MTCSPMFDRTAGHAGLQVSICQINLTNRKNPSHLNYHRSIKKSQAILKHFIHLKFSVWFTLGSENETMFCDTTFFSCLFPLSAFLFPLSTILTGSRPEESIAERTMAKDTSALVQEIARE